MGKGDFRSSTGPRPLDRCSWNLKYITTSRIRPHPQNLRGLRRRGWSGQIASLTHESFCPFLVSSPRPQVASLDTPHAQYVVLVKVVPLGLERRNLKFDPLYPQKNVKMGKLSWRPMENCSLSNSGRVSCIQFIYLVHGLTTKVASLDMAPRSKG